MFFFIFYDAIFKKINSAYSLLPFQDYSYLAFPSSIQRFIQTVLSKKWIEIRVLILWHFAGKLDFDFIF